MELIINLLNHLQVYHCSIHNKSFTKVTLVVDSSISDIFLCIKLSICPNEWKCNVNGHIFLCICHWYSSKIIISVVFLWFLCTFSLWIIGNGNSLRQNSSLHLIRPYFWKKKLRKFRVRSCRKKIKFTLVAIHQWINSS